MKKDNSGYQQYLKWFNETKTNKELDKEKKKNATM